MKKAHDKHEQPAQISAAFVDYINSCSQDEQTQLSAFFAEIALCMDMPAHETCAMLHDFQNAILYYHAIGYPLRKALRLIGSENLGDFYLRKPTEWYPLDNAAKVYPFSVSKRWMAMFRLSVHLTQKIVPEILQLALTFTIKRFPHFAVTIREGFFWHYLDSVKRRHAIGADPGLPCVTMDVSDSSKPLLRVLYAGNSISVEFFHVLTDGMGGTVFVKTLTAAYLRLIGYHVPADEQVLDVNAPPCAQESANDFVKAEKVKKLSGLVDKPGLQLGGELTKPNHHYVLKWALDCGRLKNLAAKYNTTVTALMLAMIFLACKASIKTKRGRLQIQVPVNMRKFYNSRTFRNFSLYCLIHEHADSGRTFEALIKSVTAQLNQKAAKKAMNEAMLLTNKAMRILGFVPLFIKNTAAQLFVSVFGDSIFTTSLSNIGVVCIPSEMAAHIDSMDLTLGPALTGKVNCALMTLGEKTILSVTKSTADPTFERQLNKVMISLGLTVQERSDLRENNCA